MAGDEHGSIWIESTRDPDGQPVCLVTFDKLQYYAPVEDVRATAIDLVTCAAYAEMMMTLITRLDLPAATVSAFATDLLAGAYAAFSMVSAERARRSDGKGREIRIPLSDLAIASLGHLRLK